MTRGKPIPMGDGQTASGKAMLHAAPEEAARPISRTARGDCQLT